MRSQFEGRGTLQVVSTPKPSRLVSDLDWKAACAVLVADKCANGCGSFETGDLVFQLGEHRTRHIRPVKDLCRGCGFKVLRGGVTPRRVIAYIHPSDAAKTWATLDPKVRARLEAALATIDNLTASLQSALDATAR